MHCTACIADSPYELHLMQLQGWNYANGMHIYRRLLLRWKDQCAIIKECNFIAKFVMVPFVVASWRWTPSPSWRDNAAWNDA